MCLVIGFPFEMKFAIAISFWFTIGNIIGVSASLSMNSSNTGSRDFLYIKGL